jgi:hypothetical protein
VVFSTITPDSATAGMAHQWWRSKDVIPQGVG